MINPGEKFGLYLHNWNQNLSPYSYDHLIPVLLLNSPYRLFQKGLENKKNPGYLYKHEKEVLLQCCSALQLLVTSL